MDDKKLIFNALLMWRNHIQTGNVNMSSADAVNCGRKDSIRALNSGQQEFVIRLEELSDDVLNSKVKF